jgi:hypothetical protein
MTSREEQFPSGGITYSVQKPLIPNGKVPTGRYSIYLIF